MQLQASPDFKGIKTCGWCGRFSLDLLQASPDFKGIKTVAQRARRLWRRTLQASPDFKGIKTEKNAGFSPCMLQASPDFKGIKTILAGVFAGASGLQASPDFKGIKTLQFKNNRHGSSLQASPDFKGIKTLPIVARDVGPRFKPALISKGLRHPAEAGLSCGCASSQP